MDPQLLAGRRIQRDERAVPPSTYITSSMTTGLKPAVPRRDRPRHLELIDVGFLDLVEVDEIGAVGSGKVVPPVPGAARGAGEASQRGGSQSRRDERERPGAHGRTRVRHGGARIYVNRERISNTSRKFEYSRGSGPVVDRGISPGRGARIARRDERGYREYLSEEQRREAGCPRPGIMSRSTGTGH